MGSDRLFGGPGNDTLDDAHGTAVDALRGGAGDDVIYANWRDRIYGGVGNDRIVVAYPGAMEVDCGAGVDHVTFNQPHPHVLLVGCEHVRIVSAG
jgi:Ca2+-binding RTX toxin-like protein